jgi:hypothetical protein
VGCLARLIFRIALTRGEDGCCSELDRLEILVKSSGVKSVSATSKLLDDQGQMSLTIILIKQALYPTLFSSIDPKLACCGDCLGLE